MTSQAPRHAPAPAPSRTADGSLAHELRRKTFHLATLIYLGVYLRLGHPTTLHLMTAWIAVVFSIETARLFSPAARKFLHSLFGAIIRQKESDRYTGAFYTS